MDHREPSRAAETCSGRREGGGEEGGVGSGGMGNAATDTIGTKRGVGGGFI